MIIVKFTYHRLFFLYLKVKKDYSLILIYIYIYIEIFIFYIKISHIKNQLQTKHQRDYHI